ncbi:hypothetical protein RDI58_029089 [Solanum bulbocastanum]|uniref:Uncharacterized protein n=1 Tax=Solanum bulbocastanum TaxID=147425 RepID=A0AAN8ST21_SOLBU
MLKVKSLSNNNLVFFFAQKSPHELPDIVIYDSKNALSKTTNDKAGQEALANVFHSAEAVEEFTGILKSLKMEIDDAINLSGEIS